MTPFGTVLLVCPTAPEEQSEADALPYVDMGRALRSSLGVLVGLPAGRSISPAGVPTVRYSSEESLRALVDGSAIAVMPAALFERFPSLERTTTRLVLDLADRVPTVRRWLRRGDFFLCSTEAERESWLAILAKSGRRSRRAARDDRLRQQVGLVRRPGRDLAPGGRTGIEGDEWERAVDPLRLYCTQTLRRLRRRAWRPMSAESRALRLLRSEGARPLALKLLARLRGYLPPEHRLAPPVSRYARIAARLASAHTLATFHRIASAADLAGSSRRFMDLEIDLSNKCNLRCKMCYFSVDAVFHARPTYLTADAFAPLAESILPHARTVMLSLGSEPLTSPHFIQILNLAGHHGVPELGFYTNGLLLNERVVDAILAKGVTLVVISVDGATKATFESIRVGADFDRLLRNIRMLVRRRAEAGVTTPRLRFNVTMMRQNVEELPDIVALAWRLGVQEINFFHTVVYDGLDMRGQSLVEHKAISNEYLSRARARARELGVEITHQPEPFRLDAPPPSPGKGSSTRSIPYCRFPFFHVSIDAARQVLPCPFSHGEAPYGVVGDETPFEQIWLGPAFSELRRRILVNDPPDMCRRCSFLASSQPNRAELFAPRPI